MIRRDDGRCDDGCMPRTPSTTTTPTTLLTRACRGSVPVIGPRVAQARRRVAGGGLPEVGRHLTWWASSDDVELLARFQQESRASHAEIIRVGLRLLDLALTTTTTNDLLDSTDDVERSSALRLLALNLGLSVR